MKHYLSMGFGVNSVALYLLMQDLGMEFEAVFVNHGGDWPETYEYADYFIATGRPVTVLLPEYTRGKKGSDDRIVFNNLLDYCEFMRIVPSMMMRWCTRDFKVVPMHRYIEKPCFMHLGIDAGETKRARISSEAGVESRWLLIEHNIDRQGCVDLIKAHGLNVPIKSGCYICPFQRRDQFLKLRRLHPDLFCRAQKIEKLNGEYRKERGKTPFSLRGDGRMLGELINDKQMVLDGFIEEYPPCQCGL